jgi:hypothetical protein
MRRYCFVIINLLFISALGFSQQNAGITVIGRIPQADDGRLYQLQVGSFKVTQNAERAFQRLTRAALNPSYEQYQDFTRVLIKGISARDMPLYIEKIKNAGFSEVFIKLDPSGAAPANAAPANAAIANLPVSAAAQPQGELREIAYRSIKVGETKSLVDIVGDRRVVSWKSSTPSAISVDSNGNITGIQIGNGYVSINETEYISVVVVPAESFYLVSESQTALLPQSSRTNNADSRNVTEYATEPTFRLAYRFNNKGERKGASGGNGGVDILGRGPNYEWLWTTFAQGGWFYDLNDVKREMVNGYQKDTRNGVELTVKPEFVYDNGVPYLQLKHILRNTNNFAVTGQKFGASADVMIHRNDNASLVLKPYGAYMTDSEANPSLELMFICETGEGITPVDTLWLGAYDDGAHLDHIYDDERSDVHGIDSAIGFSYQNIDLAPGEAKEFFVRFTLARTED